MVYRNRDPRSDLHGQTTTASKVILGVKHFSASIATLALAIVLHSPLAHASETRSAVWVWSMSDRIVSTDEERLAFFSFLSAPHRNASPITTAFMSVSRDMLRDSPERVRAFLRDAHSRGLSIELLTGDPTWALDTHSGPADSLLELLVAFNAGGDPVERFDGFQQDTEPYLLSRKEGDPYSWSDPEDRQVIWSQYVDQVTKWKSRIDTHNGSAGDDLVFGVAIPLWWEPEGGGPVDADTVDHRVIQDIVDYVVVMSYNTQGNPASYSSSEVGYGQSIARPRSVWVGVELGQIPWKESADGSFFRTMYMQSTSYFYRPAASFLAAIDTITQTYAGNSAFAGMAFHYYEDAAGGEFAYRAVETARAPACLIRGFTGEQIVRGDVTVPFLVYEANHNNVALELEVSPDDGRTWSSVGQQLLRSMADTTRSGTFTIDQSELESGTTYRLRLQCRETGSDALTGWDYSDGTVRLTESGRLPTYLGAVSIEVDAVQPTPKRAIAVRWSQPATGSLDDLRGYYYGLSPHEPVRQAYYTRGRSGSVTANQAGLHTLYVWTVDTYGTLAGPSALSFEVYPDIDHDGIADLADADIDGDGVANAHEVPRGSDPRNSQSFPLGLQLGYWNFDSDSLASAMAGGKPLTANGPQSFASAPHGGRVLSMNTESMNGGLSLPEPPLRGATHSLTIEMWIKPDKADFDYVPLAFFGDITHGLSLLLHSEAGYVAGRAYHENDPSGSFVGVNAPNEGLFDGSWHHVALAYNGYHRTDGTSAHARVALYVDHIAVSQRDSEKLAAAVESGPLRFFDARSTHDRDNGRLGMDEDLDSPNSAQFENNINAVGAPWETRTGFSGQVDDIRVTKAITVSRSRLGAQPLAIVNRADLDECRWGGHSVTVGIDADANGSLEAYEFPITHAFCAEKDAQTPQTIQATPRDSDNDCTGPSWEVAVATDTNSNAIVDTSEIITREVVCYDTSPIVLVDTAPLPAGEMCPLGGRTISAGMDRDGDGTLDPDETSIAESVCDTELGPALATVSQEPAGRNCTAGGLRVARGVDENRDGTLSHSEIRSTQYMCHNSNAHFLDFESDEPAGEQCKAGGRKIERGFDGNGNGQLDPSEVSSVEYLCEPVSDSGGCHTSKGNLGLLGLALVLLIGGIRRRTRVQSSS